mmetsp:Transcript_21735/g.64759  ORF Transcript_21735/g.64759 Transcript_21735/m.64759 type:complete len:311 (-) Transcript_21735:955-1887(-)
MQLEDARISSLSRFPIVRWKPETENDALGGEARGGGASWRPFAGGACAGARAQALGHHLLERLGVSRDLPRVQGDLPRHRLEALQHLGVHLLDLGPDVRPGRVLAAGRRREDARLPPVGAGRLMGRGALLRGGGRRRSGLDSLRLRLGGLDDGAPPQDLLQRQLRLLPVAFYPALHPADLQLHEHEVHAHVQGLRLLQAVDEVLVAHRLLARIDHEVEQDRQIAPAQVEVVQRDLNGLLGVVAVVELLQRDCAVAVGVDRLHDLQPLRQADRLLVLVALDRRLVLLLPGRGRLVHDHRQDQVGEAEGHGD